ncbi:MAG: AI-2E family transporter [Algoriphagus sp.]|nr:AI-2E family transporter [Algoriphagus sp.]
MDNKISNPSIYDTIIRLLILLLIIVWCLMIMLPFVHIMMWSLILGLAIFPLHKALTQKLGGKPKLASFLIIFSILLIVILPTVFMILSLIDEIKELKTSYSDGTLTIPPPTEKVKEWPLIGESLYSLWESASVNLKQVIIQYKDQIINVGRKIASGILGALGGIVQIIASLIIAGILLVVGGVGDSIRKFFRKLAGERGNEFAEITLKTIGNVVKGVIGVALILGILHGILFTLAGIPYAGIWTLMVFVLAILQIPAVIVTLPIIIYMFAVKEPMPATVWTVLLVVAGLSDNFLKPILLGKGAPVPMLIIFIGVVGGFIFSGFIGLFTGAIVMSIGYKLFVGWLNTNNEDQKELPH